MALVAGDGGIAGTGSMRFIEPVKPRDAEGDVARIYDEVRRDFGLLQDPAGNSPFLIHSVHPELLAAVWAAFYETVLAEGGVSRADKEAIAATVSRINDCPFCLEAHALLGDVAADTHDRRALMSGRIDGIPSGRRRELAAWAAATRQPHHQLVRCPPFSRRESPEVIGTAVVFHYINRLVEVFQGHQPLSTGPGPRIFTIPLVAWMAGRAMRRSRPPGRAVDASTDAELPADFSWARSAPAVASTQSRFVATVELAGRAALSETCRQRVTSIVAEWDGVDLPLAADWLHEVESGLDHESRSGVRLTVFAALAPYRVDETTVEQFRRFRPLDRDLVGAVAWAALNAARRIGSWLDQAA
jgi:AhpD family alkylhydroperoxidase